MEVTFPKQSLLSCSIDRHRVDAGLFEGTASAGRLYCRSELLRVCTHGVDVCILNNKEEPVTSAKVRLEVQYQRLMPSESGFGAVKMKL